MWVTATFFVSAFSMGMPAAFNILQPSQNLAMVLFFPFASQLGDFSRVLITMVLDFVHMLVIIVLIGMFVIVLIGMFVIVLIGMLIAIVSMVIVSMVIVIVSMIIVLIGMVIVFIDMAIVFIGMVIVLVGVLVIMFIGVIVIVSVPANGNDLDTSRCLHDLHRLGGIFDLCQQAFFETGAIHQDQIGIRQRSQIARTGTIPVDIAAGWYQRPYFKLVARDISRDISQDAVCCYHFELILLRDRTDTGQQYPQHNEKNGHSFPPQLH